MRYLKRTIQLRIENHIGSKNENKIKKTLKTKLIDFEINKI